MLEAGSDKAAGGQRGRGDGYGDREVKQWLAVLRADGTPGSPPSLTWLPILLCLSAPSLPPSVSVCVRFQAHGGHYLCAANRASTTHTLTVPYLSPEPGPPSAWSDDPLGVRMSLSVFSTNTE